MMDWKRLSGEGKLVCPATLEKLSAEGDSALCAAGGNRYPVLDGKVPLLLTDPERISEYLAASQMPDEYRRIGEQAESGGATGLKRRFKEFLERDYRSEASSAAFEELFAGLDPAAICLSVGGGPQRDHERLTNLNIGPFANVDIVADAHRLPFAEGSVDRVYSSAVFEHLYDPARAASEIRRILKPGALVYARTPFMQPYHGYPHHYQNFTLTGHRRLFESNGFTILRSGVDVGPTFSLIHSVSFYLQEYGAFPFGTKPMLALWSLFANGFLKRRDRELNSRENAHIMASTTFILARKA